MNIILLSFVLLSSLLLFTSSPYLSFGEEHEEDHHIDEGSEDDQIKQKAKEHGGKAREASHSGDDESAAYHHIKAAEYHEQLEHYDKAVMHYEKAAKKYESLENNELESKYRDKATDLYKMLGEHEKAAKEKALSLHQKGTAKFGASYVLPPKHQMTIVDLPEYITCKEGLELVLKNHHDEPLCVKSSTAEKIIQRGIAHRPNTVALHS